MKSFLNSILIILICSAPSVAQMADRHTYNFSYSSSAWFDPSPAFKSGKTQMLEKQNVEIKLSGILERKLISRSDSLIVEAVVVSVDHLGMKVNKSELSRLESAEIVSWMKRPIFIQSSTNGSIAAVAEDTAISSVASSIARTILSFIQVPLFLPVATGYAVTEDDPSGKYMALYTASRSTDRRNRFLRKTKLRYVSQAHDMSVFGNPILTPESHSDIVIDPVSDAIVRIAVNEELTMKSGSSTIGITRSNFSMSIADNEALDAACEIAISKSGSYTSWSSLSVDNGVAKRALARYRNILGDDNIATLLKRSDSLDHFGESWNGELWDKLGSLIILQPKSCDDIVRAAIADTSFGFTFRNMAFVLVQAGTIESQRALVSIMVKYQENSSVLDLILPSIVQVESPSMELEEFMTTLAFLSTHSNIRRNAQLMLGVIANHLQVTDTQRSENLTRLIIEKLDAEGDVAHYLLVLGNIGNIISLPVIKIFLQDSSIAVRVSAIRALRFVGSAEVDSILRRLSAHDNATIKQTAIDVISFRKESH